MAPLATQTTLLLAVKAVKRIHSWCRTRAQMRRRWEEKLKWVALGNLGESSAACRQLFAAVVGGGHRYSQSSRYLRQSVRHRYASLVRYIATYLSVLELVQGIVRSLFGVLPVRSGGRLVRLR